MYLKKLKKLWAKETIFSTLHFCCPSASEVFKASHVINVVPPCSFQSPLSAIKEILLITQFPLWARGWTSSGSLS